LIALRPILSSLSRNKVGAALIAFQMAVTLAILCNAVYIIQQRVVRTARPSGVDEADDFAIINQWLGTAVADSGTLVQADLAALRAMPTVADAYSTNAFPFNLGGATTQVTLHPDQPRSRRTTTVYLGDQHAMDTLGFRLSAGRNFSASDIRDFHSAFKLPPINGMLVTRALAEQLAPSGKVLGRIATLAPLPISAPIVGVIDTLQAPNVDAPGGDAVAYNSVVIPYRLETPGAAYVVRAKSGRLAQAMKAAPAALARVSRQRVIAGEFSLAEERRAAYSGDRTLALMLSLVCLILLAVTAFGIVGLTSYWVSQRRRQIGIRRALGATRLAIMQHFQTENLLITACGIAAGVVLAVAGNLWIVKHFAMERLPDEYLFVGVGAILALGQLAVLWPALRAASVPPTVATRAV
jgi:putative ABC transport system permease protein